MAGISRWVMCFALIAMVLAGTAGAFAERPAGSSMAGQIATPDPARLPTPQLFCTPTPFPTLGPGTVLPTWTPEPTPAPGTLRPTPTSETRVIPNEYIVNLVGTPLAPSNLGYIYQIAEQYGLPVLYAYESVPGFAAVIPPDTVESVRADPRVINVSRNTAVPPPGHVWCDEVATTSVATRTPTPRLPLPTCVPTPTSIPAAIIPNRYAIFLTREAAQDAPRAVQQLARAYALTDFGEVLEGETFITATLPRNRVAALQRDPRVRGVQPVQIVPFPYEYAGPPCFVPAPTNTGLPRCTPTPSGGLSPTATLTAVVPSDEYLIILNETNGDSRVLQVAQAVASDYGIPVLGILPVSRGFVTQMPADRVAAMRDDPRVYRVVQDEAVSATQLRLVTCL